jgi:hypothetical protein
MIKRTRESRIVFTKCPELILRENQAWLRKCTWEKPFHVSTFCSGQEKRHFSFGWRKMITRSNWSFWNSLLSLKIPDASFGFCGVRGHLLWNSDSTWRAIVFSDFAFCMKGLMCDSSLHVFRSWLNLFHAGYAIIINYLFTMRSNMAKEHKQILHHCLFSISLFTLSTNNKIKDQSQLGLSHYFLIFFFFFDLGAFRSCKQIEETWITDRNARGQRRGTYRSNRRT